MFPSQGREKPQPVRVRGVALLIQSGDSAVQIDGIRENDGCGEKIQPRSPVALLLEGPIGNLPQDG